MHQPQSPYLVIRFFDSPTGVCGHLVIDGLRDGLCAGGLRVREGVSATELTALARAMREKQAAVGLNVGGAKAGLDMAPDAPHRREVLKRFLSAMRPYILTHWNCGPDVNTSMHELEGIAAEIGIPSLKIAVARNRGISDEVFLRRYALFESKIDGQNSVNSLRAGIAVASACQALLSHLGANAGSVAIQGAGNLGGAAALLLHRAGVKITAWADDEKCLERASGLDVARLHAGRLDRRLVCDDDPSVERHPKEAILTREADVLLLVAVSDALAVADLPRLKCRGIVEGANLAIPEALDETLFHSGVVVVPGAIASAGGSIAVEALYAGEPASGEAILEHVRTRVHALSLQAIESSRKMGVPTRLAALRNGTHPEPR